MKPLPHSTPGFPLALLPLLLGKVLAAKAAAMKNITTFSKLLGLASIAALTFGPRSLGTEVEGDFVAHVIEVITPGHVADSTQTVTGSSASVTIPVGHLTQNITTQSVAVQISAPGVTPAGMLVGAGTIEGGAAVNFSASGGLAVSAGVTGTFAIGNINSTPRVVFAYGGLGSGLTGKMAGQPPGGGIVFPRESVPIARNTSATVALQGHGSVEIAGNASGAAYGFPLSTRRVAFTSFNVGAGFAANTSGDFSTEVRIHTYYDFRPPVDPFLKVVRVIEDVQVKLPGSPDWIPAVAGMELHQGVQISTGPFSETHLLFPDESVMVVKQMTEILASTLLRLGNAFKAQITLKIGEVSAQVDPRKVVTSDFSVSTPVATTSIRGTILTVRHHELPVPKSLIAVTEGKVEVDPVAPGLPTLIVSEWNIARVTDPAATTDILPRPAISHNAGQVVISWPLTSTNVVLEASSSAGNTTPWAPAGLPVNVAGGTASVSTAPTGPSRFFRLQYVLDQ